MSLPSASALVGSYIVFIFTWSADATQDKRSFGESRTTGVLFRLGASRCLRMSTRTLDVASSGIRKSHFERSSRRTSPTVASLVLVLRILLALCKLALCQEHAVCRTGSLKDTIQASWQQLQETVERVDRLEGKGPSGSAEGGALLPDDSMLEKKASSFASKASRFNVFARRNTTTGEQAVPSN